jgi:hypothetical protein
VAVEFLNKHKAWERLVAELREFVPKQFDITSEDVDDPLTTYFHCKINLNDGYVLQGQAEVGNDCFYGWKLDHYKKAPYFFDLKTHIDLPFYSLENYKDLKNLLENWEEISYHLSKAEELLVPDTGKEEED